MSIVLWPRQEVLQLVIPQLGTVGKGLNPFNAFHAANRLSKLPNRNGKISYENWFSVAKGCLKWSDQSASLFWEMLNTAVTYLYPDQLKASREETFIDIECVVIFLAMHISDTLTSKPAAPTVAYEAVWPLNENGEVFPSSPVASPSSPVRELRSQRVQSPLSSPMSPRSPRGSPQKPSSPRTHSPTSSRTPRASTQHLHSVRQKIAIILKALNSSDVDSLGPVESEEATQQLDFFVTRRLVNALGLVLCGGQSRDQAVTPLSALHPLWESSDSNAKLEARDLVSWINLHLSMNDLLYPALQAPALLDNGLEEPSKDSKSQQPQRITMALASLSRFSPTVLSGASATTVVHAVTCGYSRASSFRSRHGTSQRSLSGSDQVLQDLIEADSDLSALDIGVTGDAFLTNDSEHLTLTPTQSPQKSVEGSSAAFSYDEFGDSKYDLSHDYKFRDLMQPEGVIHPKLEQTLPQLFLSYYNRSKIYMISPYYGATITGCMDSDILIGAVYGAVIVNGCERVRLTVACRRLVVINCLECEFQVATLSPTVIVGDCRNLTVGPHNACYRNLKHHVRLADLSALLTQTSSTGGASVETARNVWSSLCDVNSCIEFVGATSEKMNLSTGIVFDLPKPHSSTAILQPAEQFHSLVVPFKAELANLEASPLGIPREYRAQLASQKTVIEDIKQKLVTLIRSPAQDREDASSESASMSSETAGGVSGGSSSEDVTFKLLSSSVLTKKFMEWMVATDNIQEVLDLIRIDNEKTGAY